MLYFIHRLNTDMFLENCFDKSQIIVNFVNSEKTTGNTDKIEI